MNDNVFPCCICELQDSCNGGLCHEEVKDKPSTYLKKDTGYWVIKQPNGLLCYYNAKAGRMVIKDKTREQIIKFRVMVSGIPESEIAKDTDSQLKFQPYRWEDVQK